MGMEVYLPPSSGEIFSGARFAILTLNTISPPLKSTASDHLSLFWAYPGVRDLFGTITGYPASSPRKKKANAQLSTHKLY